MFGGYNEWAVSNDLIMIYPQSRFSYKNYYGCHDTWGITGDDFATKNGVQPSAIMKMVDRLLEPKDKDFKYDRWNLMNYYSRKSWMPYKIYEWIITVA